MTKRKPISKTKAAAIREFMDELKVRTTIENDVHIDALTEEYLAEKQLRGSYVISKIATTPQETKNIPLWKRVLGIHD